MASYETVYVLRQDLEATKGKKIHQKLSDVIGRHGGKLLDQKDLGPKNLAYVIQRQTKGHFFQINFEGEGKMIPELEKNLRLSEEVLRFLTVRRDVGERKKGAKERKKEVKDDE